MLVNSLGYRNQWVRLLDIFETGLFALAPRIITLSSHQIPSKGSNFETLNLLLVP